MTTRKTIGVWRVVRAAIACGMVVAGFFIVGASAGSTGSSAATTAPLEAAGAQEPELRRTAISNAGGVAVTYDVIIGPDVPHDVAGGERLAPSEQSNATLAAFAWQQFLALTWQSSYTEDSTVRGTPDSTWNYGMRYAKPLVFETYAHRSELRPAGEPLVRPFNSAPRYVFQDAPTPGPGNPSLTLFNNLDEDNEIGSANVYQGAGDPAVQPVVLYQAKVNRAEYDYVKDNFGADQSDPTGSLRQAALRNQASLKAHKRNASDGINLPAGSLSGSEGAIEIKTAFLLVTDSNRSRLDDFFQTEAVYYTESLDPETGDSIFRYHNGTFALLGMHVIHKTESYPDFIFTSFEHRSLQDMDFQYILLSPAPPEYPAAPEDPERYPASHFNPFNAVVAPHTPGGTQFGVRHDIVRQTGSSPVRNGTLYPVPPLLDAVTEQYHALLRQIDPNSVWLNYRLIGVQANITETWSATPTAATDTRPASGPNHYMANYVIESDAFLGNFFGPGFGTDPFPVGPYGQGPDNPATGRPYRNGDNIAYGGNTYNMGGCKGCHGVAQTSSGTDFSFLLDFGADKPVVNPDSIVYHPQEP